ncbi:MAG: hypothetical protein HC884_17750, partial [Chloroflexaceae bacterium]|nr:hypothetical protein [Chloroflexaceae bacterium]
MPELSSDRVENLLQFSARIAEAGNIAGARAVVRALSHQHPDRVRVWEVLARYTDDPAERQHIAAQISRLEPASPPISVAQSNPAPLPRLITHRASYIAGIRGIRDISGRWRVALAGVGLLLAVVLLLLGIASTGLKGWFSAAAPSIRSTSSLIGAAKKQGLPIHSHPRPPSRHP